ncbi:putative (S)-N-methylcoclaurine 3'-hydroxylase isozyme 2 [Gossypium australe]|uniref:Putative (S)-N-methylcoclaurine 3'-hydroxylase isozyme 2 n=1 Tax=Gossypium australe TaxID=47621 RepID=A0A5B6WJC6_9ROSI|nr:putative (S)-N-methylcoclaurine 3'-hydroxylase isozyme 2 [Gossypium australe]
MQFVIAHSQNRSGSKIDYCGICRMQDTVMLGILIGIHSFLHYASCYGKFNIVDTGFVWARSYDLMVHANLAVTTIYWSPPERGWIKLNTDGALPSYRSGASIGGMFRDADANWLCRFSLCIGKDTIFNIEARVVLQGLQIAWENKYRKLELEYDNTLLVESILAGGTTNNKFGGVTPRLNT